MRKRAKKYEKMIILVKSNRFSRKKSEKERKIPRNSENFLIFFVKMYCNYICPVLEYRNRVVEFGVFSPQNGGKGWNYNGFAGYFYEYS